MNKKETQKQLDNLENIKLAIYVNNEKTKTIPTKGENIFDEVKSSCTNDAYIIWDYESWSPIVKNVTTSLTKCTLYFKKGYSETILNGTDPVIKDELIPVTIDSDGTVKKADIGSEWYSYEKKNWANAIILKDETEDYLAGEIIPEEKIESYFVWIPRFKYQIFNNQKYTEISGEEYTEKSIEINIKFENKNDPISNGTNIGEWLTHPAFTAFDTNGMWVGKFETGYDGATSTAEAEQNIRDANKIIVKSNVYSWRNIQVANAFYTSYDYKRNLESHMMKNTEWGAIAYFSHSKYGVLNNVRLNNNSSFVTGNSALNEPTCGANKENPECSKYESVLAGNNGNYLVNYYDSESVKSTTNGNRSGIYDMSGGSWEYVMGIMLDKDNNPYSGVNSINNSGFKGKFSCPTCNNDDSGKTELIDGYDWPDKKYYDSYPYNESTQDISNYILGDATGELGGFYLYDNSDYVSPISSWHSNYASFVFTGNSSGGVCFERGSFYKEGVVTGIFAFFGQRCSALNWVSFRIVLAI